MGLNEGSSEPEVFNVASAVTSENLHELLIQAGVDSTILTPDYVSNVWVAITTYGKGGHTALSAANALSLAGSRDLSAAIIGSLAPVN